MAGLAATAADKSNVGEMPDALTFELDRSHYRSQAFMFACLMALAILMFMMPASAVALTGWEGLILIVVLTFPLVSSASSLRLSGQVLRIDGDGILDRRLMRDPVPWSKIKRVYVRDITDDFREKQTAFAVVIDVGHPRVADMILVRGLAMEPPHDEAAVARQIADFANTMRARYVHATSPQASWPGFSRPSTSSLAASETWMPGTSSAKTRFALLPGHDEFSL
jgi:hypothetical protein